MKKLIVFLSLVLVPAVFFAEIVRKVEADPDSKKGKIATYFDGETQICKEVIDKFDDVKNREGGIPDGEVIQYSGKKKIVFQYKNNLKNGKGTQYNGEDIEGESEYKDGKYDGVTKFYHPTGKLKTELFYVKGELNGPAKTYYSTGKIEAEGSYLNDGRHGLWIQYEKDGSKRAELNFVNDNKDGICKEYKAGKLYKNATYKKGKLTDFTREYYPSGSLAADWIYKDNLLSGTSKLYFDAKGEKIKEERVYLGGKQHGMTKEYDEKGILVAQWNYLNDKRDDISQGFYETGELRYEWKYMENKKNGITKEHYKNGKLSGEWDYADDQLSGMSKTYYENGRVQSEKIYQDGKLTRERKYNSDGSPSK